ncbi:MAG: signal peptide peptidase SppA [Elusimicrobiota bacterium]
MDKKVFSYLVIGLYAVSVILGLVVILKPGDKSSVNKVKDGKSAGGVANAAQFSGNNGIGVVTINGTIQFDSRDMGFSPNDSGRVLKKIEAFKNRSDIKAVVLRINSPGGTVGAVQEIYSAVQKLKKAGKKVVASTGDISASGGYYVACAADKIIANPGSMVGSIGVIMELGNVEGLLKKVGIKIDTIKSGKMKDIGNYSRQMTEDERKLLQEMIDSTYNQFLNAVSTGRGIEKDKLVNLADGRIFTGEQAKSVGLVDELGSGDDAIQIAAALAGIKGEPRVVTDSEPWEQFMDMLSMSSRNDVLQKVGAVDGFRLAYKMYY